MVQNGEIKLAKMKNHSQNDNRRYNANQNDTHNFFKDQVTQVTLQAPPPPQVQSL